MGGGSGGGVGVGKSWGFCPIAPAKPPPAPLPLVAAVVAAEEQLFAPCGETVKVPSPLLIVSVEELEPQVIEIVTPVEGVTEKSLLSAEVTVRLDPERRVTSNVPSPTVMVSIVAELAVTLRALPLTVNAMVISLRVTSSKAAKATSGENTKKVANSLAPSQKLLWIRNAAILMPKRSPKP